MKTMNHNPSLKKALVYGLVLMMMCTAVAFTTRPGGDSFTIFINDRLMVEQLVLKTEKTKTIAIPSSNSNDVLKVYYSHCGKVGVARSLSIKDPQGKTLKAWRFEDSDDHATKNMTLKVGELTSVQKNKTGNASLFYSSKEVPNGIVLAYLDFENSDKASIK